MALHYYREKVSKIFRSLVPPNLELPNQFELILACNDCFSKEHFDGLKDHHCSGIFVICRDNNNSSWQRVRTQRGLTPSLCHEMKNEGNCPLGDNCHYAHNEMERKLIKGNVNISEFQQIVQREFNLHSTTQYSNFTNGVNPGPSNTGNHSRSGFSPRLTEDSETIEDDEKRKKRREICESVGLAKLPKALSDEYVIDIACSVCCDNEPTKHVCKGDVLLAKEKDSNSNWFTIGAAMVRDGSRRQEPTMCRDINDGKECARGEKCWFAHNNIEGKFWISEVDVYNILADLKYQLSTASVLTFGYSDESSHKIFPDELSDRTTLSRESSVTSVCDSTLVRPSKEFMLLEGYQFVLGCRLCTKPELTIGKCQLVTKEHKCFENMLLIRRNDSCEEIWTFIRPRIGVNSKKYTICKYYRNYGECDAKYNCEFAHAEEELKLWLKDKRGECDLLDFWTNQRSQSSSVKEHVKKLELPFECFVAYFTVCLPCYLQTDYETINFLNLKNKVPCSLNHEFKPILLILEQTIAKKKTIVTNSVLLDAYKKIYPKFSSNAGNGLRCMYVRNLPIQIDGQHLTFCSGGTSCENGTYCPKAHSDRELQMWYFEKNMRSRFPNQEEVDKWKSHLRFYSSFNASKKSKVVPPSPSAMNSSRLSLYCNCCDISHPSFNKWREHVQSKEHQMKFIISRSTQSLHPGCEKYPSGLCNSESEKVEWNEGNQVSNLVKTIIDCHLWERISSDVDSLLSNGISESLLTAIPENMKIIEQHENYTIQSSEIPYKYEWNITLMSSSSSPRKWSAILTLPGYYPYFYFSSGNHENIEYIGKTYSDEHGYIPLIIGFSSEKPGYYEQWLLIWSDSDKILRRFIVHLQAPLSSIDDMKNVREIREKVNDAKARWKHVRKFYDDHLFVENDSICYPLSEPNMMTFLPYDFSPSNTSSLLSHMHQLLHLEEDYRMKLLIHLCEGMRTHFTNENCGVEIVDKILTNDELRSPPQEGELFIRLRLPDGCDLYQEHRDPRVSLLRRAVQMVWIKCIPCGGASQSGPLEFECPLVSRKSAVLKIDTSVESQEYIFIILNRNAVEKLNLNLNRDKKEHLDVKNILMHMGYGEKNRSLFQVFHKAVAKQPHLANGRPILHPDTRLANTLPFQPRFSEERINELEGELNNKQSSVLKELLTKNYSQSFAVGMAPPPFVLRGCFGSGKTKTLGAFIRLCLKLESNIRILVCTHTNSAADMYITRELHNYPPQEKCDKRILRLYAQKRKVHQNKVTNNYTLVETNGVRYVRPQLSHLKEKSYRVIIMTLNVLADLLETDDPDGEGRKDILFDYILVDEAAQILEAEAMIAVTLAKPGTRLVFAGDDMQQRPIIFSQHARKAGLSWTVLDRLWAQYEKEKCPVRAHLNMVYRSHPLIVDFLGNAFYSKCGKLKCNQDSRKNQPPREVPGVVMCHVYVGGGESLCRSSISGGYWNIGEAKAIVYRVQRCLRFCNEYCKNGDTDYKEEDVCVISPFHAQINLIRNELKKRGLYDVCVKHLNDVQGREFRVVILSPVLTRKQLSKTDDLKVILDPNKDWQGMDFCHETTLLNSAMSRAISVLEVVGDAVGLSLCGNEACNNIWEQYVRYTQKHSASPNCHSKLCTLKWNKNIDYAMNRDRWAKDNPQIMGVEDYCVKQWEEERQKIN